MPRSTFATALLLAATLLAACGGRDAPGTSGPTIDPESPRAAFEVYRQAMRDGDLEALNSVLSADARKKIAVPASETVVAMLQSLVPDEETVTGVEVDGDAATLRLVAMNHGSEADGSIAFVREDGAWRIVKESWNLGGGVRGEPTDETSEGSGSGETDPVDREPDGVWRLDCHELEIPDEPATGRIGGDPFTVRFARVQNGILTLTDGDLFDWSGQFLVFLFLRGDDETLAGRTFAIGPKKDWNARVGAHVHMGHRAEGRDSESSAKTEGFSVRLEFGVEKDGKLAGRIHLSYPDEKKSYVAGTFEAEVE